MKKSGTTENKPFRLLIRDEKVFLNYREFFQNPVIKKSISCKDAQLAEMKLSLRELLARGDCVLRNLFLTQKGKGIGIVKDSCYTIINMS